MSGQTESRSGSGQPERRPYEPPRLSRVDLEAEEVLVIGCKMLRIVPGAGSTINCTIRVCAKAGS